MSGPAFGWSCCFLALAALAARVPAAEPTAEELLRLGLVDVTAPPFSADPTGERDATAALQAAMDTARERKSAVFFPAGTYRVSDTLQSALDVPLMRQGKDSPSLLLGSHAGPTRPRIVLAPRSPGFDNPDAPKPVLYLWSRSHEDKARPQANINYNQLVSNLDLTIGEGNPGAIGIHHDAAQGSGIEDCTIDAGDGYAGIVGLQAGGGGTHHVTVVGGRYGIDAGESLATAATVSGVTLRGQRISALRYNGLETFCLVDAHIIVPPGAEGPAIAGVGTGPTRGSMAIVDTQIEFEQPAPGNVAVGTNRSVYLGNVWVRNTPRMVAASDGGELAGNPSGWRQVVEYAHAVQPEPLGADRGSLQLEHVSYIDGERVPGDVVVPGADSPPPADLQSRHVWQAPAGWGSPGMVNVKSPPYNAKGDDATDDTDAIQRAIDEHDVVFLGRGRYRVSRTLRLRENTVLVGLRQLSNLVPLAVEGGDFANPDERRPLVQSADSADGLAALVYVGLASLEDDNAILLHWRTGRNSAVRSPYFGTTNRYRRFSTLISDHGGGRWYSLFKGARMLIDGTTEPLRFYQANPEWGNQPHMDIRGASDVTIYGLKEEGPRSIQVTDCDRINVYGYGGIANAPKGKALITVERTPSFRLVGLIDRLFRQGTPPGEWHLLRDLPPGGGEVLTGALERVVVYRRGYGP